MAADDKITEGQLVPLIQHIKDDVRDREAAANAYTDAALDDFDPGPAGTHASTHSDGGSDEIAIDASQIITGTIADARIPGGIARDTEVEGLLATKADIGHNHSIGSVTGLTSALDGKADDADLEVLNVVYVWNGTAYVAGGGRTFVGPEDPEDHGFTLVDADEWIDPTEGEA